MPAGRGGGADARLRAELLIKQNATISGVTYEDNSTTTEQFVRQYHMDYRIVRDVSGDFARSAWTLSRRRS